MEYWLLAWSQPCWTWPLFSLKFKRKTPTFKNLKLNSLKNEIPYTRPGRYLSLFIFIGRHQLLFTIVASATHDRKFINFFQSFGNNRIYGCRQNIGNYRRCLNHLANKACISNRHFSAHFGQYFPFWNFYDRNPWNRNCTHCIDRNFDLSRKAEIYGIDIKPEKALKN